MKGLGYWFARNFVHLHDYACVCYLILVEGEATLYEEGGLFVGCIARIKSCPFGMVCFLFAADVVVFL